MGIRDCLDTRHGTHAGQSGVTSAFPIAIACELSFGGS